MSQPTIEREVTLMLDEADRRLSDAKAKLEAGSDRQKVAAAGEIAFLQRQREALQGRLADVQARRDAPETVFQWLKEEVFNLTQRLDDWIAHH